MKHDKKGSMAEMEAFGEKESWYKGKHRGYGSMREREIWGNGNK